MRRRIHPKETRVPNTKESTPKPVSPTLTLEQIDAIDDRAPITVPVEAWGGDVQVRALTLQQINECNKRAANPSRGGEIHVEKRNGWYLVEGLVQPVITIDVAETWLTERAAGPVADVLAAILYHSGLTERAKVDATKSTPG
jgi:hypothetical protein